MRISFSKEKAYLLLVFLTLAFTSIRLFLGSISYIIIGNDVVGEVVFYSMYVMCLIIANSYYVGTISFKRILAFTIWIAYCYYCAVSTTADTDEYVVLVRYIAVFGAVNLIIGQSISRNAVLIKTLLYKLPVVMNLIGITNYVLSSTVNHDYFGYVEGAEYSMEMTYANLVSAMICTVILLAGDLGERGFRNRIGYLKNSRVLYIVNMAIAYTLVFIGGSRGPILTLIIIALFSSFYSLLRHKNIVSILSFSGLTVIGLSVLALNVGFFANSRVRLIHMIANNALLSSSGRDVYTQIAIKAIKNSMFKGTGVFNDRTYIYSLFHRFSSTSSTGSYPHNIVLEILMQFGVILGVAIISLLVIKIVKSYKNDILRQTQEVYWVLLGIGLLPLLVSKSYVQTWEFYLFLGYILENKCSHLKVKLVA